MKKEAIKVEKENSVQEATIAMAIIILY